MYPKFILTHQKSFKTLFFGFKTHKFPSKNDKYYGE